MVEPTASREAIRVGAVAQMRKPHACGGDRWVIYRVGADIGMRCQTCGRQVLLSRSDFNRRLKTWSAPHAARLDAKPQNEGRG